MTQTENELLKLTRTSPSCKLIFVLEDGTPLELVDKEEWVPSEARFDDRGQEKERQLTGMPRLKLIFRLHPKPQKAPPAEPPPTDQTTNLKDMSRDFDPDVCPHCNEPHPPEKCPLRQPTGLYPAFDGTYPMPEGGVDG